MLIEINKVIVNDRIRKDFGNIDELAQDIKENGLINPPVVTPEFELIAGERRYRAMKSLGWQQIEVRIMSVQDALHKLKLEISENENRKEFSFKERMEWAKLLENEISKKAKENQGKRSDLTSVESKTNVRTDGLVAKEVGLGGKDTYRKAKYIYENADEEMIKQLDDGKLSINGAYVSLKNKAKQLEDENNKLKTSLNVERNRPPKVIDNTDYQLVEKLKKQVEENNKQKTLLEREKDILERKVRLNEQEAKEYGKLKNNIEMLKSQQDDIHRKIEAATSISGLVKDIENVLQTKLAPIKYSRAISEQIDNTIVVGNIEEIVNRVEDWCSEMKKLINKETIITVEVM